MRTIDHRPDLAPPKITPFVHRKPISPMCEYDDETIDFVRKKHLKIWRMPIIEEDIEKWYFIFGEDGKPVAGLSVVSISEKSYPFVAEGTGFGLIKDPTSAFEITNIFSFKRDEWRLQLLTLFNIALYEMKIACRSEVVMFTHLSICRHLRMKGVKCSPLNPNAQNLDVTSALSRIKQHYGDTLDYVGEENFLRNKSPRGIYFTSEQYCQAIAT